MKVEFVFDYISPYAYLAGTRLPELGVPVDLLPVSMLKVMEMVNNQPSPRCPAKLAYGQVDTVRWARRYGVPLVVNGPWIQGVLGGTFDGEALMRGHLAADEAGSGGGALYYRAVSDACWGGRDADLLTPAGRAALLDGVGLDGAAIVARADSDAVRNLLDQRNTATAARGVFGAPTTLVDGELFFGNDRLDFVRERIEEIGRAA